MLEKLKTDRHVSFSFSFQVSAGIKPTSIVSYNHLGNNDGRNLSAPQQFRSKEISKSNVVDDMVDSNKMLYKEGEHPDHVVSVDCVTSHGACCAAVALVVLVAVVGVPGICVCRLRGAKLVIARKSGF